MDENLIFVSFSNIDIAFTNSITSEIKRHVGSVWVSNRNLISGVWSTQVENAIISCKYFIIVLSKNSVKSKHVHDEIQFERQERKTLIPILIDDVRPPLSLVSFHFYDFYHDYSKALDGLMVVLKLQSFEVDKRLLEKENTLTLEINRKSYERIWSGKNSKLRKFISQINRSLESGSLKISKNDIKSIFVIFALFVLIILFFSINDRHFQRFEIITKFLVLSICYFNYYKLTQTSRWNGLVLTFFLGVHFWEISL